MGTNITHPKSSHRRLALPAAFTLLLFAGMARGGFDWTAPGAASPSFDGERVGRDGTFPAATIAKLRSELGLTEQQAKDKLNAIRANIKRAIAMVKAQDAALGKCLEDAINCERLCIDFVSKNANAAALPDGTTDCTKDPINIGLTTVPCMVVPAHDPDLYQSFTSLIHEALHSHQSYSSGAADPNPLKQQVKRRRVSACNEIAAENLENGVIGVLVVSLPTFVGGMIPPRPAGAAAVIWDSIVALPAGQRPAAAAALLARIVTIKAGNDAHILCQQALKAAFDAFLASPGAQADKDAMNMAIMATDWFKRGGVGGSGVVGDPAYIGGGPNSHIEQISGQTNQVLPTGLTSVTDFEILEQRARAVAAGYDAGNNGVLLGYRDTDGDGFYESSSQIMLFTSSIVTGGLEIAAAAGTGDLYVLSAGTHLVYRVADTNLDGFPETIDPLPVVAPHPMLSEILSLQASPDGRTLYGSLAGDMEDEALLAGIPRLALVDTNGDGFFETVSVLDEFQTGMFTPNFSRAPYPGDTSAVLYGSANALIEVHRVNSAGGSVGVIGSGLAGSDGNLAPLLSSPLAPGWLLQVRDASNGVASLSVPVPEAAPDIRGRWEPRASFLDPRTGTGVGLAATSWIDGRILVSHGARGFDSALLSAYDVLADAWTHGGPGLPDAALARGDLGGASALGRHYAIAGRGLSSGPVEAFDPVAAQWTSGTPLTIGRAGAGVASDGERIWIFGGRSESRFGAGTLFDLVEEYDPVHDTWTLRAPLLVPVSDVQATVAHNGRVYVFGGALSPTTVTGVVQIYDVQSNTWSLGPNPMPTARGAAMAGEFNGRIAVFGGQRTRNGPPLAVTELFDPVTLTWSQGPNMVVPASFLAQGDTSDGTRVFAIGSGAQGQSQPFVQVLVASPSIGGSYCSPGVQNSTGLAGVISATGSLDVLENDLLLRVSQLPHMAFGYVIASQVQAFIPNAGGSQGTLCLALPIGRPVGGVVFNTGVFGDAAVRADLGSMPQPTGPVAVLPGETWNFQAWYRDANPISTSNFTDALSITYQ